jgi:hypothetical protein
MKDNNQQGWIKLHRSILDWEWYDEINTFKVFLHCLLRANHKEKKWRGQTIKAGSFITSYANLSVECKLSTQQVRTALNKLRDTKELAIKTTNKYTMITVCKYDSYQVLENQNNKQITNNQQTNNNQITTNKNDNNDNNEKKLNIKAEIQNSQMWIESVFMKRKISLDKGLIYLGNFLDSQEDLVGDGNGLNRNIEDIKNHFVNWLDKKPKDKGSKPTQNLAF